MDSWLIKGLMVIVWILFVFISPVADNTLSKLSGVAKGVNLDNCWLNRDYFEGSHLDIPETGACTVDKYEYGLPFKTQAVYQLAGKSAPPKKGLTYPYKAQSGQYFFGFYANSFLVLFLPVLLMLGLFNLYNSYKIY